MYNLRDLFRVDLFLAKEQINGVRESDRGIFRGRRILADEQLTRFFVSHHNIREGSPYVDSHS
jgi:hypothetical protein